MLVTLGCLTVLAVLAVLREKSIADERKRWEAERRELLNRIKPETAVALTLTEPQTEPPLPMKYDPFGNADQLEVERVAD